MFGTQLLFGFYIQRIDRSVELSADLRHAYDSFLQERRKARKAEQKAQRSGALKRQHEAKKGEKTAPKGVLKDAPGAPLQGSVVSKGPTVKEDSLLSNPRDPPPGGVPIKTDLRPDEVSMLLQVPRFLRPVFSFLPRSVFFHH
jgi:hypothetical protein